VAEDHRDRPDLAGPRQVHLVGVGGAGISAIGVILRAMGHRVSGADVVETGAWPALLEAGVELAVVDAADLFASAPPGTDLVAHSTAFPPTSGDLELVGQRGASVADRAGILAAICAARPTVAVSGTHGKTSTTAMLATLLAGVGADPSYLVGATPVGLGRAARWGGAGGLFVVEADESDGSFERLGAATAVVTNVEEDHLDHWGSIDAIEAAFDRFLAAASVRVVCIDRPDGSGTADPRVLALARRHGAATVGEAPEARYRIHTVGVSRLTTTFGLLVDGREIGPVTLATPGRHHARNAAVAVAVAAEHGIDPTAAGAALADYAGVSRRFEVVGTAAGVTVVDDYAHNPGKVGSLLASAREAGWDRVVAVFQPHRWSRTRAQGAELGRVLAIADVVVVTDVYGAGEPADPAVSVADLVAVARATRPEVVAEHVASLVDATAWLRREVRPGDLVLTVGAGDVHRVGPALLEALAR
jgi:UDP-N-acetylmuramate--alanine ligase